MLSEPEARVQASVVLAVVDLETGTPAEQFERLERAIAIIDRIALQVDDEIDQLSVFRMKESLRLLAGPAPTGDGAGFCSVSPRGMARCCSTMSRRSNPISQEDWALLDSRRERRGTPIRGSPRHWGWGCDGP